MKNNKSQKNIPDGWSFEQFGYVVKYEQPSKYIVKSTDYKDSGIPVLTAGKSFILGYTNESDGIYKKGDVIIFDDFTTTSQYVDFPFKVKSSAMKLLTTKDGVLLKFIFGWMNIYKFKVGEHKRNYLSEYQYQDVLLPPLNEQKRIVSVLEVWDEMVETLARKIEIKKNIKKGLADLLIFKRKDSKTFFIGDIFELGRGRVISKDEIRENIGEYPVYSSQTSNNGILGKINSFDFDGEYLTWTTDGANAGRVFCRNGKFNCTNVCGTAKLKKGNNVSLYFIATYLNYVTKHYVSYVGNPKLMNGVFGSIEVRLPELKEQKAIADILVTADREIEKLEEKLRIIKEQKKFLLNNLITGQIRVPVGNE